MRTLRSPTRRCPARREPRQARLLPPAQGEPWQLDGCVPSHVVQAAQERGVALSPASWSQLSELGRFALCKLARPGHDHHNLDAAFEELLAPGPSH